MAARAKSDTHGNPSKGTGRSPKANGTRRISVEHKQALGVGRDETRAVRRYLEALEAHKPRRGRRPSAESISKRIASIDSELGGADPVTRVRLVQERLDLADQLRSIDTVSDLARYEEDFVRVARSYSDRKGLGYAAWREVGIDAGVLKRAGIDRIRS